MTVLHRITPSLLPIRRYNSLDSGFSVILAPCSTKVHKCISNLFIKRHNPQKNKFFHPQNEYNDHKFSSHSNLTHHTTHVALTSHDQFLSQILFFLFSFPIKKTTIRSKCKNSTSEITFSHSRSFNMFT